ncbi:hypothetical protein ACAW74_27230 [Fibrella sp. WM1]|uniref:hypothetical protein n=1 Tax=Fibrella musci TaxID=3242485 RepID=UPI003521C34E
MGQPVAYIRYLLSWSSGLIAACLLLLLSAQAAEANAVAQRQTYLSCRTAQRPVRKPDVTSGIHDHGSIALVNTRVGFSFGPPPVFLPCLPAIFEYKSGLQVRSQRYGSYYSFRFLQLIFEHQITINAP